MRSEIANVRDFIVSPGRSTCEVVVVACIDPRFNGAIFSHVANVYGSDKQDVFKFVGGVKDLAANNSYVIGAILAAVNLHKPQELMFISHAQCDAYAGVMTFNNWDEEREFHASQSKLAEEIIRPLLSIMGLKIPIRHCFAWIAKEGIKIGDLVFEDESEESLINNQPVELVS